MDFGKPRLGLFALGLKRVAPDRRKRGGPRRHTLGIWGDHSLLVDRIFAGHNRVFSSIRRQILGGWLSHVGISVWVCVRLQ